MVHVFSSLSLFLIGGTLLSFLAVRREHVGQKYFTLHGLGVLALAVTAMVLEKKLGLPSTAVFLGGIFFFSILRTSQMALPALFFSLAGFGHWFFQQNRAKNFLSLANDGLSLLLLGFGMAAMLLGHWYLTQPKMPIGELKRVTLCLLVILILRTLVAAWGTYLWGLTMPNLSLAWISSTAGIFLLMRWAWGLFVPLLLSFFLWQTVKIRSTQSATGILYVLVLAVLAGETLSRYLVLLFGIVA